MSTFGFCCFVLLSAIIDSQSESIIGVCLFVCLFVCFLVCWFIRSLPIIDSKSELSLDVTYQPVHSSPIIDRPMNYCLKRLHIAYSR